MQSLHVENHGKTKTVIGVLGLLKKRPACLTTNRSFVIIMIKKLKYLNVTKWRCGIVAFDTFSNACCQPSLSILPSSIVL